MIKQNPPIICNKSFLRLRTYLRRIKLFPKSSSFEVASWRKFAVTPCGTKWGLCRFFSRFVPFSSYHKFNSTPYLHSLLIHFLSFHFISLCDCATGVDGRHPCHSLTFNKGASSYLIPRPGTMSDTS